MRKLFRFKYEACDGMCYAWCDTLPQELNKLNEEEKKYIVSLMVKAHEKLCDNPNYYFGVDLNEEHKMFIGFFTTPSGISTFISPSFYSLVNQLCSKVLITDIPKVEGSCVYGSNGGENLGEEILRACVDHVYRHEHHTNCPCSNVEKGMFGQ